jgi:serine/threonine protein kinase
VHRDLKPANIFLTKSAGEEDFVKVLDFGIAKSDEKTDSKEQKLTQRARSRHAALHEPRAVQGQELDARSDIYSLGVVTYEMLTGRCRSNADTPWEWATQHMTAQPFPFEVTAVGANVPPKMRAAILRGLEKDRNKRQSSVKQFFEELGIGGSRVGASMVGQQSFHPGHPSAGAGMASGPMQSMQSGPMPSMPGRPGGTQLGEPIFTQQQPMHAPAGRTVVDTGQNSAMSMTPQPMPAMPMHTHPQQQMHGPPMGNMGGPAYPAPPPPQAAGKPSSSMLPIVAIVGVVGLLGIVGAIIAFSGKGSGGDGEVLTLPSASSFVPVVVASDPPPSASSSASADSKGANGSTSGTTNSTGGSNTGTSNPSGPQPKPTSTVDAKADAACDAAISLARGANTSLAISQYRSCAGPKRSAALSAINTSATREVQSKKCAAKGVAVQAASIGATGGKDALPASCK